MNFKIPLADPPIKTLHHHAFNLSVLLSDEKALPSFYNNFIMLSCPENCDGSIETIPSGYREFPHIERRGFLFRNSFDFFDSNNTLDYIVNMNIKMLKSGYCVEGEFDEFYIPGKAVYQQEHFMHNYLLIGVCEKEQYFYSAGYNILNGGYSKYSEFIISFEDYKNALLLRKDSFPDYDDLWRDLFYIKPDTNTIACEINTEIIREQLYNYLGINGYEIRPYEGINTISYIAEYIGQTANIRNIEIKSLRFIMEHAQIMLNRAKYLDENGFIEHDEELMCQLEIISKIAEKQFMLAIKYSLTRKDSIILQIQDMLYKLVNEETIAFNSLAEKIYDPA